MESLTRVLLCALYPFLVIGRILNTLRGSDPLHLREPRGATCWIEHGSEAGRSSYFSEASASEGKGHGGSSRLAGTVLVWVARLFAPARKSTGEGYRAGAERDQEIPDEIYTLW